MQNSAEKHNRKRIKEMNVPHEENEMERLRLTMRESGDREKNKSNNNNAQMIMEIKLSVKNLFIYVGWSAVKHAKT